MAYTLLRFRPHRMHEIPTIAIDDPGRLSVYKSVCHAASCTQIRCGIMSERIEVLFGVETTGTGPKGHRVNPLVRCGFRRIALAICYKFVSPRSSYCIG